MRAAAFVAARRGVRLTVETAVPAIAAVHLAPRPYSLLDEYYTRTREYSWHSVLTSTDLTYFDEVYPLQMTTTARLTAPACVSDCSPFKVRVSDACGY